MPFVEHTYRGGSRTASAPFWRGVHRDLEQRLNLVVHASGYTHLVGASLHRYARRRNLPVIIRERGALVLVLWL
mgnify:FL=1